MMFHNRYKITLANFAQHVAAFPERPPTISAERWRAMKRHLERWQAERDQMSIEQAIAEWEAEDE